MPRPTLEELRAEGALLYAAWHLRQGEDYGTILPRLQRRYPGATDRTYLAVLNQAQDAETAGAFLSGVGPPTRVPAHDVPGPTSPSNNYQYYGTILLCNPDGSDAGARFGFNEGSLLNLDSSQLYNLVVSVFNRQMEREVKAARYEELTGLTPCGMEVISVQRLAT
jgi:hypothetical protein